jgi:hypothetical protein
MAFATATDLAAYLRVAPFTGADETAANLALDIASSIVTARTGQDFVEVADDEVTLETFGDTAVVLPQRPVTAVTSVTTRDRGSASTTTRSLNTDYEVRGDRLTWVGLGGYWPYEVTVTYTHGYATIPTDVKGATLAVAAEIFDNPEGLSRSALDDDTAQHEWADDSPAERMLKLVAQRYGRRGLTVRLR